MSEMSLGWEKNTKTRNVYIKTYTNNPSSLQTNMHPTHIEYTASGRKLIARISRPILQPPLSLRKTMLKNIYVCIHKSYSGEGGIAGR